MWTVFGVSVNLFRVVYPFVRRVRSSCSFFSVLLLFLFRQGCLFLFLYPHPCVDVVPPLPCLSFSLSFEALCVSCLVRIDLQYTVSLPFVGNKEAQAPAIGLFCRFSNHAASVP